MKRIAKVSGKHQATIPLDVRMALGLHAGDRLVFDVSDDKQAVVTVRRYPTLDEVAGTVPTPPDVRGLPWSEIRERAWTPQRDRATPRAKRR